MSSSDETRKINAYLIIEVIGKPKEHLMETLENISKEIDSEKGVTVKSKRINEPTLMKDQKEFFTSFADIEVEVDKLTDLAILIFKYMPANVEIVSPEILAFQNSDFNDIFNELVRRLHGYDEIARILQTEKNILENKLRDIIGPKVEENIAKKDFVEKREKLKKVKKKVGKKKF